MCAKRKLHSSISWRRSGPSYTPYGGGESTSTAIAPASPHQYTSMAIATQPWRSKAKVRIIRLLYMCEKRKLRSNISWRRWGPSYTQYGGGESTSTAIAPTSPRQYTASTTATQPWRSKAKVRIIRLLYMCAKRKLRSSISLESQ
jgi:hypothetical protein